MSAAKGSHLSKLTQHANFLMIPAIEAASRNRPRLTAINHFAGAAIRMLKRVSTHVPSKNSEGHMALMEK
jgi:hypothetical protein